jgi:hypothetical protein
MVKKTKRRKNMNLISDEQRTQLLKHGRFNTFRRAQGQFEIDYKPVVKLFCPWGGGTWLLSELDPDDPDLAFGLCDLGLGSPELGSVRLSEIESIEGPGGLRVERDLHFVPVQSLLAYAEDARLHQRIIA